MECMARTSSLLPVCLLRLRGWSGWYGSVLGRRTLVPPTPPPFFWGGAVLLVNLDPKNAHTSCAHTPWRRVLATGPMGEVVGQLQLVPKK